MFKVGDTVRIVEHSNYQRDPIKMDLPVGSEHTITSIDDHGVCENGYTLSGSASHFYLDHNLELVNDGPVREVTRREIVPGVYGRIVVDGASNGTVKLTFNYKTIPPEFTAEELREAAHIFNQLAEAME